ncbi:MAG TPA: hypothetical protein VHC49_18240, partial [Mycobacteriales bacterium]|nr:hypothetical protein [Mycobacteriales bacterium]
MKSDFCVTTSPAATGERIDAAVRTARRWQVDFVPRAAAALSSLRRAYPAVLVFEPDRVRLADPRADVRYSAGIAYRRIATLRAGGRDPLLTIAGLEPGTTVLDATLGL